MNTHPENIIVTISLKKRFFLKPLIYAVGAFHIATRGRYGEACARFIANVAFKYGVQPQCRPSPQNQAPALR